MRPPTILAIDPGSSQSAWVLLVPVEGDGLEVRGHGIDLNPALMRKLRDRQLGQPYYRVDQVVIEFMAPQGMPTSREEMETLWWAGQFTAAVHPVPVDRLIRRKVKEHLCGNTKAKDPNVRQALIDRFGGVAGKAGAVGTKANRGPLYGVANDEWAALAVGVTWHDGIRWESPLAK